MTDANAQWAARTVEGLPFPWRGRLLREWDRRRTSFNAARVTGQGDALRAANVALRETIEPLEPVCDALPLAAGDHTVTQFARQRAAHCTMLLKMIEAEQKHAPTTDFLDCVRAAGVGGADVGALDAYEQRRRLMPACTAAGIAPPEATVEDAPAVRRMVDGRWWVRRLRTAHARAVEAAAITLGYVSRSSECYVSNVSLEARNEQNARNAASLESTIAVNLETKQEFTLAQLAAKGTANKAIRRAELMTRINGFERIAIAAGHAGLFATFTCPSKMHRMTTAGGRAVSNSKYDGTLPNAAQAYLGKVWARIRAALARGNKAKGWPAVSLYGFRIAEPQHDGTPHWHLLLFYPAHADVAVRATIRRYALEMDGDEPGAQAKRVDLKRMDPAKGTAAGYIAKYVAKNIDGYRLEKDLLGNDALETSARVEAWASRWHIRQFQQIGGPPVTVWRELRRVEAVPSDAPDFVIKAHNAVNRVATFEGRDNASVAWNHYVEAQGGVACGRRYRVRIAKVQDDTPTRYGEARPDRPIGIEYRDTYRKVDGIATSGYWRARTVTVESKRYTWDIKRGAAAKPTARPGHAEVGAAGMELGLKRAQRAPWTCVNNCTDGEKSGRAEDGRSERGRAGRSTDLRGRHAERIRTADTVRKSGREEVDRGSRGAGQGGRGAVTH
ncbi:TPA: replication endonuclease [Burkholderia vietnamiensis]|nr:replication endonuclease [Burkholderia vietnamiensis]